MKACRVSKEWSEVIYRYLIDALDPGSFFTAFFANDLLVVYSNCHPLNNVADPLLGNSTAMKNLVAFLQTHMPSVAYGSYDAVNTWLHMGNDDRRLILEEHNLIYTREEEIMLALAA